MRTEENLEKCLAIYKKNNRSRYITLPEMRKFLRDEFGMKVTTRMKKPEVNELFVNNLSASTYEKYKKLDQFGMFRMDVQDALGMTCIEARELLKSGVATEKREVKATGSNFYIKIYDMDDVLELMS